MPFLSGFGSTTKNLVGPRISQEGRRKAGGRWEGGGKGCFYLESFAIVVITYIRTVDSKDC